MGVEDACPARCWVASASIYCPHHCRERNQHTLKFNQWNKDIALLLGLFDQFWLPKVDLGASFGYQKWTRGPVLVTKSS